MHERPKALIGELTEKSITVANILEQQQPRNRRLAEAFAKCGLVERAGQGMDLIYEQAIRHSKPLPDFTGTSPRAVRSPNCSRCCRTFQRAMSNASCVNFGRKVACVCAGTGGGRSGLPPRNRLKPKTTTLIPKVGLRNWALEV